MIRDALSLTKFPISLMVALSSLLGYFLNGVQARLDLYARNALLCFAGTLLLCMGAAALNNIQDRRRDRLMARTRLRPLARGSMRVRTAAVASVALLALGLAALAAMGRGAAPAWLGALAVLLYNAAYTPLKTKSLWGLVAGAVSGALPVLIGWTASLVFRPAPAGAALQAAVVFLLLFVWQMPHFWLLMLHYREDYAGLPGFVALQRFGLRRLEVITMAWVACFAALLALAPMTGVVTTAAAGWIVTAAAGALVVLFARGLFGAGATRPFLPLFVGLNLCVCLLMAAVAVDRLVARL